MSGLSILKCLIWPCSTNGVGNSSLSILILILFPSGKEVGGDLCTSPFWGLATGVSKGEYGTYILTISGLGLWGVALGVECELNGCFWILLDCTIPEPTELAPPMEFSDILLCVSRLFSCGCERVIVENTDKSAVDVTLVSANECLDPVCWQSSREFPSSRLGSNEHLEPRKFKKKICVTFATY